MYVIPSYRQLALVGFAVLFLGCQSSDPVTETEGSVGPVTIRFQAGEKAYPDVVIDDVADGTTLESLLRQLDGIEIDMSGSGAMAFVNSIDGIETNATEGWTFKVDGEFVNHGVGKTILHPPTKVEWSFGVFEP